jgi:putative transposase
MAGKRDKPEEIVLKLRQVEVLQGQGRSIADAVRQIGVTQQTYYRWRKEYGGMSRDQLKRLKELEAKNIVPKKCLHSWGRPRTSGLPALPA